MPELPEVEVTRRALAPALVGCTVTGTVCRVPRLRSEIGSIPNHLAGKRLTALTRRGKYLIWRFEGESDAGWLVTHLGMSGYWRLWESPAPQPDKHDHVDLVFGSATVRLTDPRRFSDMRWFDVDPCTVPPLSRLGSEPFAPALTDEVFAAALRRRRRAVKEVLMAGDVVVGAGNIYSSESLFAAGIDPRRSADRISVKRCGKLLAAIRTTLSSALEAGGTTLRDFHSPLGEDGWFSIACNVYGRAGEPCRICGTPIARIVQNGRATYYCPKCQK